MAQKPIKKLKLIVTGGKANPGQSIGPALGQAKVNIGEFVSRFNEETRDRMGELVPVVVSVFEDRTFTLQYKVSPASALLLSAAKLEKGSGKNATEKVGTVTKAQVREIAEKKMPDLNAKDVEGAMRIIEGSARSMGIDVK